MTLHLFAVAVMNLVLLACSRGEESYFPLGEGLRWEYQLSSSTLAFSNRTLSAVNLASEAMGGRQCTPKSLSNGGVEYYYEDNKGLFLCGARVPMAAEPRVFRDARYVLQYPVRPGFTWTAETEMQLVGTGAIWVKHSIEATDETISVPAGKFDKCIKVSTTGQRQTSAPLYGAVNQWLKNLSWFCKGVGLVKMAMTEGGQSGQILAVTGNADMTLELVTFARK
jgi:hypothetical protein